jgi:hypothetical protein
MLILKLFCKFPKFFPVICEESFILLLLVIKLDVNVLNEKKYIRQVSPVSGKIHKRQ